MPRKKDPNKPPRPVGRPKLGVIPAGGYTITIEQDAILREIAELTGFDKSYSMRFALAAVLPDMLKTAKKYAKENPKVP